MSNQKIKWLNCARFIAMTMVIIDHTKALLYKNDNISIFSFFSVSLFILISGMLSYASNEKHNLTWYQTFFRASRNIIITYLIANVFYLIAIEHYFDLKLYLKYIFNFNISEPFYYVIVYLQLMLISKCLYNVLKKNKGKYLIVKDFLVEIVVLIICYFTTNYTNILNIYGGGGVLFGGTFLFIFSLGMLIAKYKLFNTITLKKSITTSIISLILGILWFNVEIHYHFLLDSKIPFGTGINPPSITLTIMALIMLSLSFGIFTLFEFCEKTKWITNLTSWMGEHTLYIFLYHITTIL